jgi:hypothetical protein
VYSDGDITSYFNIKNVSAKWTLSGNVIPSWPPWDFSKDIFKSNDNKSISLNQTNMTGKAIPTYVLFKHIPIRLTMSSFIDVTGLMGWCCIKLLPSHRLSWRAYVADVLSHCSTIPSLVFDEYKVSDQVLINYVRIHTDEPW